MKFIVKGLALTAFLFAGLHTHASNTPITNVTPNYVTSTYAKTKYPVVLVNTLTPLGVDGAVGKIIDVAVNFITIGQQEDPKKYPMDSLASAHSLSRVGATNFNAKFPAGVPTTACGEGEYITNGVRHYSFSGAKTVTNLLDPLDYVTTLTGAFMGSAPHDGLVSSCSSHFGQVIRDDYYWNHFDEVNQLLGLKSVFSQDPVSVYRQHLNRLKLAGV